MTKTTSYVLFLVLCLYLVSIPATILVASGNSGFPIDKIVLHGTYTEFDGSHYIWDAEGTAYGDISGTITWHEEGYLKRPSGWGVAIGNLTTYDGEIFSFQLGGTNQPYAW